jgi:signal transduction histidine kinase
MELHDPEESVPHLLIVDDEPVILQILKAVFEDEPYRLTLAATGRDALDVIQREGVDLLLTDKNLPDVNGLDLLRAVKESNPDAEVIIITGYASLETALTAMELDAFDYVLKPLNNVFDIRKKIRRAVEKQRLAVRNRVLLEHLQRQNAALEQALAETRRLQAELIQSEKLAGIGTLAAGIAHEVSNPLFGVLGLAEAILDEDDRSLVTQYARDIVEYCQGIRTIVMELSSYSRAAKGEYLTTVDLPRAIRDAIRLVERSAQTEGIRFDTRLEEPCLLQARTNEIQQVFVNLVKNAVEALAVRGSAGGGLVQVRAGTHAGKVWAEVEDNGPGIAESDLTLVFDPFYTTKQPGQGTGLGLNIVYRIVTKYRGTVAVRSTVGQGTVFTLTFPADG